MIWIDLNKIMDKHRWGKVYLKMRKNKLEKYEKKRDFNETNEPSGKKGKGKNEKIFVVQKHQASNLHYDFRLVIDGVLKSWAIPKGPSMNPKEKRLAIQTEDHPIDYQDFEGVIPEGQYGAGKVIVWDKGEYKYKNDDNVKDIKEGLEKGEIKIELRGEKLKGVFVMVKMKGKQWLLIKKKDKYSKKKVKNEKSVKSGKTIEEIGDKGKT